MTERGERYDSVTPLGIVPCLVLVTSSALSQTVDTARVRAAYDAATARRNEIERSHGRFVTVSGIRMQYLEWGEAQAQRKRAELAELPRRISDWPTR